MTLLSLNTSLAWPGLSTLVSGSPSVGARSSLTSAGHYDSVIFSAREAMTITHVGFRVGTSTGSPTADVRVETVAGTGLPSGSLFNGGTQNIVTGALSTGWTLQALTTAATVTAGQMVCIKIAYATGTALAINSMTNVQWNGTLPYYVLNTGAATKGGLSAIPCVALGSSSTTFYGVPGLMPIITNTANVFNNTSSAHRGLRFKLPVKTRCVGIRWFGSTSTGDVNAMIMDDSGAELSSSSTAIDGDISLNTAAGSASVYFDSPVTLSADTWYRAALQPSSATNINLTTWVLSTLDYRSGMPSGTNAHYYTFAGSLVDTATDTLPVMDILLDQFDDGASTSGARVIGG